MTCSSCGGKMVKVDETSMKCEKCGHTMKMDEVKDDAKEM